MEKNASQKYQETLKNASILRTAYSQFQVPIQNETKSPSTNKIIFSQASQAKSRLFAKPVQLMSYSHSTVLA